MRRAPWALALAVVAVGAGGIVAASASHDATAAAPAAPANTVEVARGELSSLVTLSGTLTYRAQADGAPYSAINQARGTYTRLPDAGDQAGCGDVLYRVDDDPVLLLCGTVPAYRGLRVGDQGRDVRQLNRNLRRLGHHGVRDGTHFTARTKEALKALQRDRGAHATGVLALGDAVVLPRPVRVSKVDGRPGEPARPGSPVAEATSDTLEVQVDLEVTQQGEVKRGDRAQITLPSNTSVPGTVDRIGRVARTAGKDQSAGAATIPAFIRLDKPQQARGLDRAPVQVDIITQGVKDVLSVPTTALVGRSGGGFAVEAVRDGGRRELVAVELGLFDTANGRVEVSGDLAEGDRVVVPSL